MLPRPDRLNRYHLSDGSRIYPSGRTVRPGEWLAWFFERRDHEGRRLGRFLTEENGVRTRYFGSPGEALAAILWERGRGK